MRVMTIVADIPFERLRFAVVDCETTGIDDTAEIVDVAVRVVDAAGTVHASYEHLVRPLGPVGDSVEIHGLTDTMLRDAPTWAEVGPAVDACIGDAVLVGHNVAFEAERLAVEHARHGLPAVGERARLCTMILRGRLLLPGMAWHRLSWACWLSGIPQPSAHRAQPDVLATEALLVRYVQYAHAKGYATLADLPGIRYGHDEIPTWDVDAPADQPVRILELPRTSPADRPEHAPYLEALAAQARAGVSPRHAEPVLHPLAVDLGLTGAEVTMLHRAHVRDLVATTVERTDGTLGLALSYAAQLGVPERVVRDAWSSATL